MTLKDLKTGASGTVISVGGEKVLRRRLLEMGITPGTSVTVKKVAPMGDPIELLLRGYVLTLRLDDAAKINIQKTLPSDSGWMHTGDCSQCGACREAVS